MTDFFFFYTLVPKMGLFLVQTINYEDKSCSPRWLFFLGKHSLVPIKQAVFKIPAEGSVFLWERHPSRISECIIRLQINMTKSF